ncbi:SMI1/KNR4 family protein [Flavobacterium restrictum]|uniref:SMI1/KNR4 family protein n=1 Tax=Flavobacterium restrictum TaxID=2594428 RepID=A0A553DMX2_9FLAO|nr:SMI1/KNR4 family protein [Flavobacterium restrictum]TRX34090.1 SMI1/KNR4 family protein [Flavobacterium restrictum]
MNFSNFFNFFKSKKEHNNNFKSNENQEIRTKLHYELTETTSINDVINFIDKNKAKLGFELNAKATENEIANFEKNKIHLPDDLKIFYSFSNGLETDEDLFRIIPLEEITKNGDDEYLINPTSFHIAEYLIYCEMWTIDIDLENRNNYRIYNKSEEIVILTNSFAEFLVRFINGGIYDGLYKWQVEIRKDKNTE